MQGYTRLAHEITGNQHKTVYPGLSPRTENSQEHRGIRRRILFYHPHHIGIHHIVMGYDEQHGHNPEQFQVGISFLLYISLIISNLNWGGNLEPLSDKDLFISPAKLRNSGETSQSPALNHPKYPACQFCRHSNFSTNPIIA